MGGALMVLACAAACSLPLLLAGGAAIGAAVGAGALLSGAGALAAVLLVTAVLGGLVWLRRRHARPARARGTCAGGCDC